MNNTLVTQENSESKPVKWYREFYVWLVILFPTLSIIMGITTIALSVSSYDGLVVDDYYRRGLAINEVLAREENADRHGLKSSLNVIESAGRVVIRLTADDGFEFPRQLNVHFMHATRAGHDQLLKLSHITDGHYEGNIASLSPGHWHVEIAAGDWRLLESHWEPM